MTVYKIFPNLKQDIIKTKKVVIGLGCSFVRAHGAINDELYDDYDWNFEDYIKEGYPMKILVDDKQKKDILERYKNVKIKNNNDLDFTYMQYDNSFVNVLAQKIGYTPINLGIFGGGNRATIKELYFLGIDWSSLEDIIIVYCPSGMERFDFIDDKNFLHANSIRDHWKTMWPLEKENNSKEIKELWVSYKNAIYGNSFEVFEQICNVQELLSWTKLYKARLIITPAFDIRYNKKYFEKTLLDTNISNNKKSQKDLFKTFKNTLSMQVNEANFNFYIDLFPWDKIFKPQGYETFALLAMSKEEIEDETDYFFQFLGKGSKKRWITPCSHPGKKAHQLFAEEIYKNFINI